MDPDQQLRNLRDFLLVYNRMTEICFQRCSSNFNYRTLTMDEDRCVDNCAGKLIRSNHRLMGTYVQLMPKMVQRRMEEMESKMAENAKAAEAAAAAAAAAPAAAPATETSSLPAEVPPMLSSPTAADVGPGLEIPVAFDAAVSKPTAATDVKLSAAAAVTPAADAVHPPALGNTVKGPFHTVSLPEPQPQIAGAQIEFESSAPLSVSLPSNATASSADLPASAAAAAPAVSQSTENLSGPGLPPPSGH